MANSLFPTLLATDREGTFWFPPQASTFAQETDSLFMYILYISIVFFVLVVAAMVMFMFKYRRRPGYKGDSTALHNNALEITWTVIPTLIVCWIFARGVYGYMDMMRPPAETIDINVEASQWNWLFEYPNGAKSGELHVPIDRAVRLRMRSKDVIHSFFVPAFRAKTDIVPGRVNIMWFQPILEGKYPLYCTEYCGDKHSEMLADVFVHQQAEFDSWLAEAAKPPTAPVEHGKWLYERVGCKSCHSIEPGKVVVGPSFAGSYGSTFTSTSGKTIKVDENYIRESILVPQAEMRVEFAKASQMPSFQGKLKEDEITALTAFIEALQDGQLTDEELTAEPKAESDAEDATKPEAESSVSGTESKSDQEAETPKAE
ncbi:MAG: cytochrome c oxidase subunit II [Maritimibacter sp.]|nr:cytochrome c oxidase subunit II [Maritimibacter sp.]